VSDTRGALVVQGSWAKGHEWKLRQPDLSKVANFNVASLYFDMALAPESSRTLTQHLHQTAPHNFWGEPSSGTHGLV
jgi:hypothetical protein